MPDAVDGATQQMRPDQTGALPNDMAIRQGRRWLASRQLGADPAGDKLPCQVPAKAESRQPGVAKPARGTQPHAMVLAPPVHIPLRRCV